MKPILRFSTPGHRFAWLFAGLMALAFRAGAQELIPDTYTISPVGINGISVAGTYSSGDLSFDPSLPVEDGNARLGIFTAGYLRTVSLAGRSGQLGIIAPYVVGHVEGVVLDEFRTADRHGFGDLVLRGAVNLLGAAAMGMKEYAAYVPRTTLGASLIVSAPVGQYDPTKFINIGTNRWAFKPEAGLTIPAGHWEIQWYLGGWFFTTNTNYTGGKIRQQDPILATQAHLLYNFRRGLWLALDANFWVGGRSTVDGVPRDDLQRNSRVGLTLALPVGTLQSLRLALSRGAITRIGGNFTSIGLSYSYGWR